MSIRRFLLLAALIPMTAAAQSGFPSYQATTSLWPAPFGSLRAGLNGYENPALLSFVEGFDAIFAWDSYEPSSAPERWGAFFGSPGVGFGMVNSSRGDRFVQDYRLSFAFGDRSISAGWGIGWSNGEREFFDRRSLMTFGIAARPSPYLSFGLSGTVTDDGKRNEAVVDAAVRPFGNEKLAAFFDYGKRDGQSIRDGAWSAGLIVEPIPGLRLAGRYFDTREASIGVQIGLGALTASSHASFDRDGENTGAVWGLRVGDPDRDLFRSLFRGREYLQMDMKGGITHQRYQLFDNSATLRGMLETIDAAIEDDHVRGIAINTSGMAAGREMLWEIRDKLAQFRAAGKKVVVFVDRADMDTYHFASVADRIIMDPLGQLMITGYALTRTYLKGSLEKLGIGFDEWRFFTHKSAYESYSRDRMSDADREQRQALIDAWYDIAREDICAGRRLEPARFDTIVSAQVAFLAADAQRNGLIDSIGRWDAVPDLLKTLEGDAPSMVSASSLERFSRPADNRWGEPPKIAVIYALGACAMDEGITARSLVKDVDRMVGDRSIAAIVLRVESPGGDALASDIVAEALKKARGVKPVIISQGAVAASGGYWLSMYGDTIVAAPGSITGSIGVIGGWFYNHDLKESLGMTTDRVQIGAHADLGSGFVLPYIGLSLPDRNLTVEERARMEQMIRGMYDEFVRRVAEGRGMPADSIRPIAEGHVWSGRDGKRIGLVDLLGGLDLAIAVARERAGICPSEPVTIVEAPAAGLFNFSALLPGFIGLRAQSPEPVIDELLFRIRNNGLPMPLLPMEWE